MKDFEISRRLNPSTWRMNIADIEMRRAANEQKRLLRRILYDMV